MSLVLRQLRCLILVLVASLGLSAAEGTGTGLLASYYANETLSGSPTVSRTDAQVNFSWSGGAPVSGMPVDSFSIRWEGEVEARFTENLTLITRTDDGVRLWLDGQLVIDAWVLRSAADSSYTFAAEAGRKYRIRMEYYEHFGSAVAQLLWQSASIPRAAIPVAYLYPNPAFEPPFGTGTGLLARYYANETLSGSPVLIRNDARVDFGWGGGSPDGSVPVESFSARWDGEIEPRVSEPLTLIARTDDGVRVWLNGQVVIDAWVLRSAADSTYTFSAEAGQRYRIRMEYYEHTGAAVARLWWQSANEPKGPIPTSQLYPTDPVDPPNGTGTGLLASYFPNETLSGAPVLSRTEARVDHAWAGGSPGAGVPVDVFSARWLGEIEPRTSETLTIIARTDDGVRLWLDGQLVIDQWILRGAADSTYTFSAEAGRRYSIRMEYFEHYGSAVAKLWWQSAAEPKSPIPTSQLYPTEPAIPPAGTGTGLFATYFANETLTGDPILSRVEPRIDHNWGGGSPGSPVPVDVFSARWEGEIESRVSEPLTLIARTDDGVRVWLDDAPVIDAWILRGAADSTYTFTAVAGQRYRIRMEYFEHYGSAVAKLWWQSANEPKGPIPTSQLYPITGTPTTPTIAFVTTGTTVAEDVGSTSVTVALSQVAGTDVTVAVQSSGSGATAPATVLIPAGSTTVAVPVTISDDPRFGPDRQVTLSLADPVGANLGLATSHILTLLNTDPAPTIAFTAATSFNLEQSGTASVIVRLSAVSAQTTTVTVGVSGTATPGSDFVAPAATLQIPADTFEGVIFIPLLADSIPEQDEAIILALSDPVGATLGSPTVHTITLSDGNQSPVIANGPTPAVNPVTGTSVGLSFSATDDGGAANLSFTWSTVGTVPAPVSFSPATGSVGTTSTTTATFTAPGTYAIQVQVRDAYLATATAQTMITVQSTPAVITVSPSTATVSVLGTQTFTAAGVDQFGTALAQPLPVVWSVTGGGSIATNGVFTAGTSAGGPFTVLATLPTAQGNAAITVIDQAPTLVQGPTATVDAAATGLVLTALATDDGGETALTYQWSVEGTAPGTVQFAANSNNAAKSTTATLSAVGTYVLRLTATDGANQAVSATTSVTVDPVLAALAITPATAAIGTGATQDFTISGTDQFNAAVANPAATWMASGGGTIATTANGARFTAGSEAGGPHTITASSGAHQATAEVTILSAPVISQQPLSQSVLTGETATFSVAAVGAAPLAYAWQVSTDAGATWQAVVGDGTGTSYQTPTLSLTDHGSRFRVTVSNPAGTVPSDEAVLSVAKRVQTITFNELPSKLVSDAPFALTGTASSGLAVSYQSSDPAVASITGTSVTIHAIGTTTITAEQAGDDLWQAAEPVPQVLTVAPVPKQPQTITFTSLPTKTVGDAPFMLTASASSGLPVSYTSSDAAVATVSGSTVTILGAGTTTITAAQPGDDSYDAALSIDQPLTVVGRPAPVVSYVKSTLTKATLLGTYPTDIGITGIDVTIIDPAGVISFSGDVKGGVFQVEVDNATPAVAQVTVALAFRFGADLGPLAQRTVPFGAPGGGGGDYEDGSPEGVPPFPPGVTLVIESGLTGKQQETIDGKVLHFTKNDEVEIRVHTSGSYGPITSITVISSDGQSVPATNGVATLAVPAEGVWSLSATAVAVNDYGVAAGFTTESTWLVVDRTSPQLIHVLPSRYWPPGVTQPVDAPPPSVPLHHGVDDERLLVRLNGNDTGTNAALRNEQWLNVFDHAGYTGEAQVGDLSGLRTDVTQSGEAKDRQGYPTSITITVRPPEDAERGDPQTVLLQGFANLADSVEYSGINESNRRGLHRLAVTLEDRAGNRLEAHDEYDLWVQTKAPEAKFAIRMGASAYAIEADETQLSPARFIFTSADIEEGWQDSRDDANRLQLLRRSANGPRLWLLKTPKPVPPDSSASVNVILRDRAGGISEPVSVTVSRQVLHEDLGQSLSEGPLPWFAKETYYDFETPLFRDAGTSPTDEFMWSIPDNDRLAVPLGPHRGNVEGKFTMTRNGEIPYDPEYPEYGGYPVYKVTAVTVAGNKGYVEHTHLNVSPLDVGDGAQRRFAPAVITIPPSWKQDPPNVTVRVRDQGIAPVRALGQLQGTITLAGVKTPSQPDGIFDLTQGTDTNSITAEIDLRRTINDPDAGPVAPGQPIPQVSGAQPGLNAVQYVVSVGESGSGEYVQSTPYTGNAAYRWMNLIRLSPDLVTTGWITVRIEAGFLTETIGVSQFDSANGDYVHFIVGGNDVTETRSDYESHKNDVVRPTNRISIIGQRLIPIESASAPMGTVQALELDLQVGSGIQAAIADVEVKFGAVKAYTDDLSAPHAGDNGGHIMQQALKILHVDVDIDSDNNDGLNPPTRSSEEESSEVYAGDKTRAGKVMLINNIDKDHDGIDDYADGYGLFGGTNDQVISASDARFVPLIIDMAGNVTGNEKMKITYQASDPLGVTTTNGSPFLLPTGFLRLWKKDAFEPRSGESVQAGGDYVAPGIYSLNELGVTPGVASTWYLEAVRPIEKTGSLQILVEVDPDGTGTFMRSAAVNVHPVSIEILGKSRDDEKFIRVPRLQESQLTNNEPLSQVRTHEFSLYPINTTVEPSLVLNQDGTTHLYGGGSGWGDAGEVQPLDSVTIWGATASGPCSVQARVMSVLGSPMAGGGVVVRSSLEFGSPFVALMRKGDQVQLVARMQVGGGLQVQNIAGDPDSVLRLSRSAQGIAWSVGETSGGAQPLAIPGSATIGWFALSGSTDQSADVSLIERSASFFSLPYPADTLTPSNYFVQKMRILDPRDLDNPHVSIGSLSIPLQREDSGALVTAEFVLSSGGSQGGAIPNPYPVKVITLGEVSIQYNPEEQGVFYASLTVDEADKKVGEAIKEVVEDMKANGWTSASGSIDGTAYDPADSGAFGKEVHKRVAAKFTGLPGWQSELYVDNMTLKIHDKPLPPGQTGRTNVDLMRLKNGYSPKVGDILDPAQIEDIYEIKTSVSGDIAEDQKNRLKAIRGGDIKTVNTQDRWSPSKGWHVSSKFLRFVRVLSVIGLAVAPVVYVCGSEGDDKLTEITTSVASMQKRAMAGELAPDERRIEGMAVGLMMKQYMDLLIGSTPVQDLLFLGWCYDLMGTKEFAPTPEELNEP